ncbi:MAG: TVP38/TMEM64 family protein [Deltaproteobacteria bacterium]|nr:TVP38/TMEM64 family protein [Deltaproteobacteria bacterium]MBW1983501.1 TVP38/TMEM64 family protein [Deltaproteobacteria bacterium]MBW2179993.1 TVP38/TMEM64 family protein [Deltaproteobacteria bacterium]
MPLNNTNNKKNLIRILIICIFILILYLFKIPFIENLIRFYNLLSDRENIKIFITSFGPHAPVVFIFTQILQVVFAPIPGEVTSFIGGYLFGAKKGFFYSSVGLTIGSVMNFAIGRFFGKRYIRRLIPSDKLESFDKVIRRQGIIIIFLLFVFPGFPKDYLCLFLGISAIPFKVFIILASIGRMPGTFMLSLKGEFLYDEMYGFFILALGGCVILAVLAYWYRETISRWIERFK